MAEELKIMRIRHLARELSSVLELALVGLAPNHLVDDLAAATGLLVALERLPLDTQPLRVWASETVLRAEHALAAWRKWEEVRKAVT